MRLASLRLVITPVIKSITPLHVCIYSFCCESSPHGLILGLIFLGYRAMAAHRQLRDTVFPHAGPILARQLRLGRWLQGPGPLPRRSRLVVECQLDRSVESTLFISVYDKSGYIKVYLVSRGAKTPAAPLGDAPEMERRCAGQPSLLHTPARQTRPRRWSTLPGRTRTARLPLWVDEENQTAVFSLKDAVAHLEVRPSVGVCLMVVVRDHCWDV